MVLPPYDLDFPDAVEGPSDWDSEQEQALALTSCPSLVKCLFPSLFRSAYWREMKRNLKHGFSQVAQW